jgi:hypothetical protein
MNTLTATHRIPAFSALSLALLISGTTEASHRSDPANRALHLHEYESAVRDTPICASGQTDGKTIFHLGARQSASSCTGATRFETPSAAPIRLAKPLSRSQDIRYGESIRYSF